jgi:hypothetical protein
MKRIGLHVFDGVKTLPATPVGGQSHLVELKGPVEWTGVRPTRPGFYYWKKSDKVAKVLIARVEQMESDLLFVSILGTWITGDLKELPERFQWSREPFKELDE